MSLRLTFGGSATTALEIADKPEEFGVSRPRLDRIATFFRERYVDTGKLPGMATVVTRRGQVVHYERFGFAHVERAEPVSVDTIFRIYSMTKPVVSVALMTLYEQGKFQLDDPVSRFIPAFRDLRVFEDGTALQYRTSFPERESDYLKPPAMLSGGGGLVSTVADYHRFTQMLLNRGELEGARILGRKTIEYMTINHLPTGDDLASMGQPVFSETTYEGIGFGLGFSVMLNPARAQVVGSVGEFAWGGAASTMFWVDPSEELTGMIFTQLVPSSTYPIRREMKALTYQALID